MREVQPAAALVACAGMRTHGPAVAPAHGRRPHARVHAHDTHAQARTEAVAGPKPLSFVKCSALHTRQGHARRLLSAPGRDLRNWLELPADCSASRSSLLGVGGGADMQALPRSTISGGAACHLLPPAWTRHVRHQHATPQVAHPIPSGPTAGTASAPGCRGFGPACCRRRPRPRRRRAAREHARRTPRTGGRWTPWRGKRVKTPF